MEYRIVYILSLINGRLLCQMKTPTTAREVTQGKRSSLTMA